jgi:predicted nucleic acid-binding protein
VQRPPIVIDSSVLVRIFDEAEDGHGQAVKIGHYLVDNGIRVRIPYHALFEVSSTFKRKNQSGSLKAYQGIAEMNPLLVDPVPVDEAFFSRYFDASLPYLKAGDSLFLAMAKKDSAILITEDKQQYAAAQSVGVQVFRVEEFLAHISNESQSNA